MRPHAHAHAALCARTNSTLLPCPRSAEFNARRRASQQRMMVPLLYAPLLPLIRLGLRNNPPLRDAAFGAAVLAALAHAGYIMSTDSTM